jgi:hypothetical protein
MLDCLKEWVCNNSYTANGKFLCLNNGLISFKDRMQLNALKNSLKLIVLKDSMNFFKLCNK